MAPLCLHMRYVWVGVDCQVRPVAGASAPAVAALQVRVAGHVMFLFDVSTLID